MVLLERFGRIGDPQLLSLCDRHKLQQNKGHKHWKLKFLTKNNDIRDHEARVFWLRYPGEGKLWIGTPASVFLRKAILGLAAPKL